MLMLFAVVLVVSGALVAGAAWGIYGRLPDRLEGFLVALAGGALLLSVTTELIQPSIDKSSVFHAMLGVAAGAIVFCGLDYLIDEKWGSNSGGGLLAAITLDGIPENLALGVALIGALGVGIAGRAYAQRNGIVLDDPETIFIVLSDLLFHPLITGFLFAALLAAIMSTISSQLLVSSSSLTEDFYRLFLRKHASEREAVNVGRICVALVAVAAIFIARDPNSEVLGLVSNAWAGFGAAFGPLIILALTWDRMTGAGAVAGLLTGAAVVGIWIALGWNSDFINGQGLYEIVPGFIASWLAIVLVSKATEGHKAHA